MTNIPLKSFITLIYDEAKLLIPISSLVELEVKASGTSLHYKDEHVSVVMPIEVINLSINLEYKNRFVVINGNNVFDQEDVLFKMNLKEIVINEFSIKCPEVKPLLTKNDNIFNLKIGEF